MTPQQQACARIINLSDEGAIFINQVLNSMNPAYFLRNTDSDQKVIKSDISKRIGIAEGIFEVPEDFDAFNDEIANLFEGDEV